MNIIKRFYVKQMVKQIDKSIKVKFGKCLQCEPTENTIYVNNKREELFEWLNEGLNVTRN